MCTSRQDSGRIPAGFSIVELLVALSLGVCVALAIAPLAVSLQREATTGADQDILFVQGRVAIARLERDFRSAGAQGCRFPVSGAVVEATADQVVFLMRGEVGEPPLLVEWEIARGCLMRRWGPCPTVRPVSYPHSLYVDNKTMLDGLAKESVLAYEVRGAMVAGPVDRDDLPWVRAVRLDAMARAADAHGVVEVSTTAMVGR